MGQQQLGSPAVNITDFFGVRENIIIFFCLQIYKNNIFIKKIILMLVLQSENIKKFQNLPG